MDIAFVVKRRLKELGLEQRDLAVAAEVTESYISQLLARKKTPPAPSRTDLYEKIGKCLKLPRRELSRLAELERNEALKKRLADPPEPLFKAFRALILRKCHKGNRPAIREIFEKEPFGAIERLVTQNLLDVVKRAVSGALNEEEWAHRLARLSGLGHEQMRVTILEFLDTDVFHVSAENCVSILDPLIKAWSIDLETFAIEIILNRDLVRAHVKRLEYLECVTGAADPGGARPGGVFAGPSTQRRRDGRRNRIPARIAVRRAASASALLLPCPASRPRPASFSTGTWGEILSARSSPCNQLRSAIACSTAPMSVGLSNGLIRRDVPGAAASTSAGGTGRPEMSRIGTAGYCDRTISECGAWR